MDFDDGELFFFNYRSIYSNYFTEARPLFYTIILIWLIVLFYVLYVIADRHFTWSLENFSKYLKLSPDMAGMTLLAFGNGAPDFFTSVLGASESPELILGGSVGSCLFIVSAVFGFVILFSQGHSDPINIEANPMVAGNLSVLEDTPRNAGNPNHLLRKCPPLVAGPFFRNSLLLLFCVVLLWVLVYMGSFSFWLPLLFLAIYFLYLGFGIAFHFVGLSRVRRASSTNNIDSLLETETDQINASRLKVYTNFSKFTFAQKFKFAFINTCFPAAAEEEAEPSTLEKIVKILMFSVKAPFSLLFNLTILPVELPEETCVHPENWVSLRFFHRLRCFFGIPCSAFLLLLTVDHSMVVEKALFVWPLLFAIAIGSSVWMWKTTSWTSLPKFFILHVVISFCSCIVWIFIASSELISCLSSVGNIAGIRPAIMGILVLAWGNSFGDLVADVAVAKNGGFETAVTAIFAGPIQNILLTIGAAFLIAAFKQTNLKVVVKSLRFDIYFALGLLLFIMICCIFLIPFAFDFRIPRYFGFILVLSYVAFLPLALLWGLGIWQTPF